MKVPKIKIIGKKVKYRTPFLEFVTTNYFNMNGKLGQWFWCRRPNAQRAVVIIAVEELMSHDQLSKWNHLVVTKEFRVPIEGYEVGFPAGLIDEGETPEDAVRRELEEETGLIVEEIMHISPPVLSSAGLTDEAVHLAYVKVSGEPNKDKLEASEDIETSLLNQKQVASLLESNETFGKTAYGVMKVFAETGEI